MFPACEIIRFFTDRGYAVAAPNRRGRGESTGTYVEECEGCSPTQYYSRGARGLDEAIRDLDTVVSALAATPDIDSSRIMMTGPSRGGFLSVIYAAERPQRIWSIVNFAGGWFSTRDNDPKENLEFNVGNLRRAGMNAQVTMLWLYRDMDRRHSTQSIRRFYDGYRELGGNAVLRLYTNEPGKDGHNLMFEPALWSDEVRAFLDQLR
jgi:dienelactone hydrolase